MNLKPTSVPQPSRGPYSATINALKDIAAFEIPDLVQAVLRGATHQREELTEQVDGIYRMIDALKKGTLPSEVPGLYEVCKANEDRLDAIGTTCRDLVRSIDSELKTKKL